MPTRSLWLLCIGLCTGFLLAVLLLLPHKMGVEHYGQLASWAYPPRPKADEAAAQLETAAAAAAAAAEETATLDSEVAKRVRIFCWIPTYKDNHESQARPIKETWAPRCDKYLFMSDEEDPSLPSIKLDVPAGKVNMWEKVTKAVTYLYENHLDDYDWFMRGDGDTYLVVENLRLFLMPLDPNTPAYYGTLYWTGEHTEDLLNMQGGAGFVLSRAALKLLVEKGLNDPEICSPSTKETDQDDTEIGVCMRKLGVPRTDSRDAEGRHRFLAGSPEWYLGPKFSGPLWIPRQSFYPLARGPDCCSAYPISFHYISGDLMRALDYLIYRVRLPLRESLPAGVDHAAYLKHLREVYAIAVNNIAPGDPSKDAVKSDDLPPHLLSTKAN